MVPYVIDEFQGMIFVFGLLPFVEIGLGLTSGRFFCYDVTRQTQINAPPGHMVKTTKFQLRTDRLDSTQPVIIQGDKIMIVRRQQKYRN